MGREASPLPPSFRPGDGADEQARLAALRHQGATSVMPGSGYEGYKGPESSNWQYCQKLPPEASGQARVVSGHAVDGFSRSPQKPVIVVGPGEQFGSKTLKAPENGQDDRFEPGGFLRKTAIRLGALAAAIVVAVGGIRGINSDLREEADRASESRPNCQTVVLEDGPKHYPDGSVGISEGDRQRVDEALDKLPGGYDVDSTVYGVSAMGADAATNRFAEGTAAEFCVAEDGSGLTVKSTQPNNK